ncbi:hypothetical protein AB0G71_04645 [Streptomyces sp. NPDC020403]|uniref:imine reductase family protein n=1 Tax=unclassified Streptomyces TaxID=2593676 RepID=UPI0033DDF8DA
MTGAMSRHIVETSTAVVLGLALPSAVPAPYRQAMKDGHGSANCISVIDSIRGPTGRTRGR